MADNKDLLPPREEDDFDFSVLFREEEPGAFNIANIIQIVLAVITLVVLFLKK